jgi:hypothetical protein
MSAILSLWLPILLSAVVVFVISSLVHMVIKWHAGDYGAVPNEDAVRAALRAGNLAPGRYVVPQCKEMKEMASPEMQAKYREGPVGHLTILPNVVPNMGKYLGQWFLLCLLVSTVVGFLVAKVYGLNGTPALGAAKFVGAVTFIAHGFGTLSSSIWEGRPWGQSMKYVLDAVLYAIGSAAVFYWLWP